MRRIGQLVTRELKTLARTRTFSLLGVTLAAVLLGIAWVSGSVRAGYVPTVVDLLTPLELLVPVVAIAFGYRAIASDEQRGELDILDTYPVTARELVFGVYIGRAVGLLAVIIIPLGLVASATAYLHEEPIELYATHASADSPILFVRFIVLTALFALAVLAVAIAISALASGTRGALGLSVVTLVILLVGLDLALVYGLASGYIGDSSLVDAIAISPLSAYRGLVFETVVVTAAGTGPRAASPISSVLGLTVWTIASLAASIWAVRR
ncbi:ABC transporter permease [Natrialbaceae archaeon A-arb3/5]